MKNNAIYTGLVILCFVVIVYVGLLVVFAPVFKYVLLPSMVSGMFRNTDQAQIVDRITTGHYSKHIDDKIELQQLCFIWGRMAKKGSLEYNLADTVIARYLKDNMQMDSSDDSIMCDEYIRPNVK